MRRTLSRESDALRCSAVRKRLLAHLLTSCVTKHANSIRPASDAPFTSARNDSAPDTQDRRPMPLRPASGHSRNFSKLSTGAIEKCISFSQKQRILPRKLGGMERGTQTPLYPSNSTSFLKCANTTMCVPTYANVLAFSQTFSSKELS